MLVVAPKVVALSDCPCAVASGRLDSGPRRRIVASVVEMQRDFWDEPLEAELHKPSKRSPTDPAKRSFAHGAKRSFANMSIQTFNKPKTD